LTNDVGLATRACATIRKTKAPTSLLRGVQAFDVRE
jgi:hypothetical protein